jgi:16S rRNA (uracil1498-N3)-methyltransferase
VPLPPEEAAHAIRVLRLGVGDEVYVVDGKGSRSHATLETVTKRGVIVRVTGTVFEAPALPWRVTVAAALLKNSGRYETMLEKVAELGAVRVIPLVTRRTENRRIREDRARKILAGAMKQSGSAYLTELGPVTGFTDLLASRGEGDLGLICHETAPESNRLSSHLGAASTPGQKGQNEILVIIGPEGGFTDEEVEQAEAAGFATTWLGNARLRAETASIVAVAAIAQVQPSLESNRPE